MGNCIFSFMNGTVGESIDQEIKEIKKLESETDPADNYPHNYTPKPTNPGKIIWISGGTGMGKSTTSLYLKNNFDYVLYEGDGFLFGQNPYVGAAPEGTGPWGTRGLSGISTKRQEVCKKMVDGYMEVMAGKDSDPSIAENFYTILCEDIIREHKKLGGNWVINQAVYTRAARDFIRNKFETEFKLIILGMDPVIQIERLANRITTGFGESGKLFGEVSEEAMESAREQMKNFGRGLETVQPDEPDTFALDITGDMSVKDVAEKIIEFIG